MNSRTKQFLASVIGKFSAKARYKPSFLRDSGSVSIWKNSWKDLSWISRKSGKSTGLVVAKLILLFVVVDKAVCFNFDEITDY